MLYSPNDTTTLFSSCPIVLAVRNLSPYEKLGLAQDLDLKSKYRLRLLNKLSKASTRKARKVIFASEYSKSIISKQLSLPSEKCVVIYHGFGEQFNTETMKDSTWEERQPYILSVSSIYSHKNYITLIRAFARLVKEHSLNLNLLIAGKVINEAYFSEMKRVITSEGIQQKVQLLGEVKYSQISILYKKAKLFVFPSYLEAFGMPVIEAMASGIPVVSSNASAMPEVCADAALYFNPFNIDELTGVMLKILTEDSLWETMRSRALERSREFSWRRAAQKTLEVLKMTVEER